jgi:hypothetical protein
MREAVLAADESRRVADDEGDDLTLPDLSGPA